MAIPAAENTIFVWMAISAVTEISMKMRMVIGMIIGDAVMPLFPLDTQQKKKVVVLKAHIHLTIRTLIKRIVVQQTLLVGVLGERNVVHQILYYFMLLREIILYVAQKVLQDLI